MQKRGDFEVETELSAEDERKIRALVARCHDAACRADPDVWGACWATNAVLNNSPHDLVITGRDEIVAFWSKAIPRYEGRHVQVPAYGMVWLSPDGPRGRWPFFSIGRVEGEDRDHFEVCCYVDRYVQEDGQWRFAEREVQRAYLLWNSPGEFRPYPALR